MPRVTRIAGSFAIVVIAYWAYALLAVPWIEPPVDLHQQPGRSPTRSADAGEKLVDVQIEAARRALSPGRLGTEESQDPRKRPAPSCSSRDYRNFADGRVEIHPCTIVFAYEGPAERRGPTPPPVDHPRSPRRRRAPVRPAAGPQPGQDRPAGGRATQRQSHHPQRLEGARPRRRPADRHASDIQLTEQTISTPSPVDFRWGPHFGRGRDMVIKLLAGQPQPGAEGVGPEHRRHRILRAPPRRTAAPRPGPGDRPSAHGRTSRQAACRSRSIAAARSASTWSAAWPRFATAWT